jgi:hypothetical protein
MTNIRAMNIIKDHNEHQGDDHQQKIMINIKMMNMHKKS